MPTVDYEAIKNERLKENVKNLKVSEIEDKICNFAKRSGFSIEEIKREIKKNMMLRWFFAKDPLKQNIHEQTAMDAIKNTEGVKDFKKYHTNEMYVVNGALFTSKEIKDKKIKTRAKGIDFYWRYGNKKFYASHKYTKDEGGAQTNQYKDLQSFIESCNNSGNTDAVFLAIADGDFYKAQNGKAETTRIKHLKDLADRRRVFAITIDELEETMDQVQ